MVGHAEDLHGGRQLAKAMRSQCVVVFGGEMCEIRQKYFAFLTQGAGHQGDSHALRRQCGHSPACGQCLVVGMRVDQKQAAVSSSVGVVHEH